jgi:sulfate adenylyltransferase
MVAVAAFQTRNPMHRSHEYLAKVALEVCDGVLVHSLLGNLKPGDIPGGCAHARDRAASSATTSVPAPWCRPAIPSTCVTGGPREALLHAVFRQNYGCASRSSGRDHAGVGSYYGPFDRAPHLR